MWLNMRACAGAKHTTQQPAVANGGRSGGEEGHVPLERNTASLPSWQNDTDGSLGGWTSGSANSSSDMASSSDSASARSLRLAIHNLNASRPTIKTTYGKFGCCTNQTEIVNSSRGGVKRDDIASPLGCGSWEVIFIHGVR